MTPEPSWKQDRPRSTRASRSLTQRPRPAAREPRRWPRPRRNTTRGPRPLRSCRPSMTGERRPLLRPRPIMAPGRRPMRPPCRNIKLRRQSTRRAVRRRRKPEDRYRACRPSWIQRGPQLPQPEKARRPCGRKTTGCSPRLRRKTARSARSRGKWKPWQGRSAL